tara:strand:- start:3409 stop:3918 length:510 start_codon:yes stop_codon:yes gene_type:complete
MKTTRVMGVFLLVAISACAIDDTAGPPQLGAPIPGYTATTLEGDSVSLSSLRGEVVLLNLWATWCAPCRKETPFLQELFEEHEEDGLHLVGVSLDTGAATEQVERFVEDYGVTYTILHDPENRAMELYRVLGLPATFLIDREGVLQWMRYGPVGETDQEFLSELGDALG